MRQDDRDEPINESALQMRFVTICRSSQGRDDADADKLRMALTQMSPQEQEKFIRLMDLLILSRGDELAQRAIIAVTDPDEIIALLESHLQVRSRLRGRRTAAV